MEETVAYDNYFLQSRVDVDRIYRFLQTLQELGNPFYQFFECQTNYQEKLLNEYENDSENVLETSVSEVSSLPQSQSLEEVSKNNEEYFSANSIKGRLQCHVDS